MASSRGEVDAIRREASTVRAIGDMVLSIDYRVDAIGARRQAIGLRRCAPIRARILYVSVSHDDQKILTGILGQLDGRDWVAINEQKVSESALSDDAEIAGIRATQP